MPPFPMPMPGAHDAAAAALPIWLALLITGSIILFFTLLYISTARRSTVNKQQKAFYVFIVVSMVLTFFDMIIENSEARFFHFVTGVVGLHSTQFIVAMLVIAAGFGAHRFKQSSKLWYGYSEVTFGVVSAVLVVTHINFVAAEFKSLSLAQYGTLVGCAYVVARGLNNISEAKEEKTVVVPEVTSPEHSRYQIETTNSPSLSLQ